LAVTAVDADLRPYRYAIRGDHVDLAAPGVRIWSAAENGTADYFQGTSFATPFVTATAATLLHSARGVGVKEMRDVLRSSARDLGSPGKDPIFGWGLAQLPAGCRLPLKGRTPMLAGGSRTVRPIVRIAAPSRNGRASGARPRWRRTP
jgi:subtilisin family serine protease